MCIRDSPEVIAMEKALREEAIASKGKFSEKLLNKYPYYAEAYVRDLSLIHIWQADFLSPQSGC